MRAAQIAAELDSANHERRAVETRIRFEAEAQMTALGERSAYVLAGEGWHAGVIGIVASRLVERSGRPVVMIALDGERRQGLGAQRRGLRPARRADRVRRAACGRYGGHSAAAGLEIERGRIEEFAAALGAHADARARRGRSRSRASASTRSSAASELGMALAEELRVARAVRARQPEASRCCSTDATAVRRAADGRRQAPALHASSPTARARVRSRSAAARGCRCARACRRRRRSRSRSTNGTGVSEPRLVLRRAQPLPAAGPRQDAATAGAAGAGGPPEAPQDAEQEPELVLFALP